MTRVNAYDHADEQQTLSTVMVHPAITVAGEIWRSRGTLRKLVIQGTSAHLRRD